MLCITLFAGCSANKNPDQYVGYWVYTNIEDGVIHNPPFEVIHITENSSDFADAVCFDQYGEAVDSGRFGLDREEGELTFFFNANGNMAMYGTNEDNLTGLYFELGDHYRYVYQEEEPFILTEEYEPVIIPLDGMWQYNGDAESPFASLELFSSEVTAYDEEGLAIGIGTYDYNEQRALNGNPLLVIWVDGYGEYGGYNYSSMDNDEFFIEIYSLDDDSDVTYEFIYVNP